jgi:hypothetical protein
VPQTSLEGRGFDDLVADLRKRLGLRVATGPLLVRARHSITFRRITLEGYEARLESEPPRDAERFRWAAPDEVGALPTSSMTQKIRKGLETAQLPLPLECKIGRR